MCLSTVYKNTMAPETIVMRNVMAIECKDGCVILTDLMERQMAIEGTLERANLVDGYVIVKETIPARGNAMEEKLEQFRRVKHFIWDFDGTLFDTYPVIIRNLRSALARYGRDCDPVEAMGLMLEHIPAARNFYADQYGIDREELKAAYEEFHHQANAEMEAQPMAGVREVLKRIRETGGYNYIFTHRKLWETEAYLKKYDLLEEFRDLIGPESPCFASKPAPDAILYLMKTYDMDPEETVMVGDRDCDLGSGRNAGIKAMHLICKAVPENLVCDWRLEDFETMLAMLK